MVDTSLTNDEVVQENASENCSHLKQLWDNNIKIGVSMSKAFSRFNFLTVINLNYTNLENGCTIALVKALKNSVPFLKVVEMAGNNITDEAAPAIAACLAAKRHLKKMNFSENDLKEEGCIEIVKIMEELELEYVDMSYNELRRGGALSLAHVVVNKESFKMLNIDGNVISVKAIEEVKEVFKNCPKLLGSLDENDPPDEENENQEDKKDNVDDDERLEKEMKKLEDFEDEFLTVFFFY